MLPEVKIRQIQQEYCRYLNRTKNRKEIENQGEATKKREEPLPRNRPGVKKKPISSGEGEENAKSFFLGRDSQ